MTVYQLHVAGDCDSYTCPVCAQEEDDDVMPAYHIDSAGEFVDFEIPDATGLARPTVLTIPTDELGRIYVTARAAQLGADPQGDL